MILSKDVRHITIPQYEGLALKHISKHLDQSYQHVYDYLPDAQEIHKIPKEWICNVIATIVGEPFFNWVKSVVAERNKTVSKKKGDVITMDAAVANAFFASTKVSRKCRLRFHFVLAQFLISQYVTLTLISSSVQHGVGANLMKDESKRRRTKKQIKSDEEAKLDEENATRAKIARVDQLEYQLAQAESQAGVNKDASVLLSDLISSGVLKQHAQNQFSAIGPKGEQHFDYDVSAQ